eukprot:3743247-Amphidinium_carterae.1
MQSVPSREIPFERKGYVDSACNSKKFNTKRNSEAKVERKPHGSWPSHQAKYGKKRVAIGEN